MLAAVLTLTGCGTSTSSGLNQAVGDAAALLPRDAAQIRMLLRIFLLDLAMRKLSYELDFSPERIRVPCHAILELLEEA